MTDPDSDEGVEHLQRSARVQAEDKGLTITTQKSEDVPQYFVGDSLRLRQILTNLVTNAVKFTERGLVTIGVKCLSRDGDRARLHFSVKDTGIGIAKEKQQTIFEGFTQADGRTTRRYGGTGLGTTIAQQLVELMGGQIQLESEPGKGSTFWFTLTVKTCDGPSEITPSRTVRPTVGLRPWTVRSVMRSSTADSLAGKMCTFAARTWPAGASVSSAKGSTLSVNMSTISPGTPGMAASHAPPMRQANPRAVPTEFGKMTAPRGKWACVR